MALIYDQDMREAEFVLATNVSVLDPPSLTVYYQKFDETLRGDDRLDVVVAGADFVSAMPTTDAVATVVNSISDFIAAESNAIEPGTQTTSSALYEVDTILDVCEATISKHIHNAEIYVVRQHIIEACSRVLRQVIEKQGALSKLFPRESTQEHRNVLLQHQVRTLQILDEMTSSQAKGSQHCSFLSESARMMKQSLSSLSAALLSSTVIKFGDSGMDNFKIWIQATSNGQDLENEMERNPIQAPVVSNMGSVPLLALQTQYTRHHSCFGNITTQRRDRALISDVLTLCVIDTALAKTGVCEGTKFSNTSIEFKLN